MHERRKTAYHEAGHAIAAEELEVLHDGAWIIPRADGTAGRKPAPARQLRAALDAFLKASGTDDQRKHFGKLIGGLAARLPELPRVKEEEPPHLDEVPVPVDRRDRANCHMEKAYYVIEAMRELAADPQNFDVPSAPTVVEHMAIRAQTLALAGMCALDNPTIADEPAQPSLLAALPCQTRA